RRLDETPSLDARTRSVERRIITSVLISGTSNPVRRLPLLVEIRPTSQGTTAPPTPAHTNTGPAALGERSPKCRESRAIVFGNTDANPNPDNNAPVKTPALPLASSSVTMPPNEITNPASTRPHSLTRRSIAGARALPASSAPQNIVVESDQSAGSASPPSRDE